MQMGDASNRSAELKVSNERQMEGQKMEELTKMSRMRKNEEVCRRR